MALKSVIDDEAIWRLLVRRDFKVAAVLYQPPARQEDVNITERAESKTHWWAFFRHKV
jgi:hypothetical protein